jgi:small subunit ribosomal protein S5
MDKGNNEISSKEFTLETEPQTNYTEQVICIRRVAKVVAGGKRLSFSAMVVVGDGNGHVGCALGKGVDVRSAIDKGVRKAKKNIIEVPIKNGTIPHGIISKFCATKVVLQPASEGTGIIASGPVRSVLEAAGFKNVLTKCIGSTNPINVVYATFEGLKQLRNKK